MAVNYSYNLRRLRQTLDSSCSPSSSTQALFRNRKISNFSFFDTRRIRLNQVRRALLHNHVYGLISVSRHPAIKAVATSDSALELPLTAENVESVLDKIRPYLIADGGNVALLEIDGKLLF